MTQALDARRVKAFERRIDAMLNAGALALLTSIGHRTGLFDVMRLLPPSPAKAVAIEAGLDRRYVADWLAAMATGGFIEYDAQRDCYHLPAEHAACLARAAAASPAAAASQWIALLGAVEDELVACFERGTGLPVEAYPRLQVGLGEPGTTAIARSLCDGSFGLAHGLVEALSSGRDVLELASGSGHALCELAARFPRSRFTGYESTASALEEAREEVSRRRLRNLHFVERDGPPLHAQSAFDLILTAASSWRAPQVLRRLFQALRSRGWLLLQEPASLGRNPHAPPTPLAPFLYTISCLYRTPLLLGPSRDASAAVPSDHEQTRRLLATAGFGTVEQHVLPGDRIHAVLLARRTS